MLLITITIKIITNLMDNNLQFHNATSLVKVFPKLDQNKKICKIFCPIFHCFSALNQITLIYQTNCHSDSEMFNSALRYGVEYARSHAPRHQNDVWHRLNILIVKHEHNHFNNSVFFLINLNMHLLSLSKK